MALKNSLNTRTLLINSSQNRYFWLVILLLMFTLAVPLATCSSSDKPTECSGANCAVIPGCETNSPVCNALNVCLEQVCEGQTWICGLTGEKKYKWQHSGVSCDDNNACTQNDVCVGGHCQGLTIACNTPPNQCQDGQTLRTYNAEGTCDTSSGQCFYTQKPDYKCKTACQNNGCVGEPCVGLDCTVAPSDCFSAPGVCNETTGKCVYTPKAAGTACTVTDKCYAQGKCNSVGVCEGTALSCQPPNTKDGVCVQGVCQGITCIAGYGNCNNNMNDGCETKLNTLSNCGKCGTVCGAVANATPSCDTTAGKCLPVCTAPWNDCDGVYSNGCEIPVGRKNSCDQNGLTDPAVPTGCGTPICGDKTGSRVKSFATWSCVWCTSCHNFSASTSGWCLIPNGVDDWRDGRFSTELDTHVCDATAPVDATCSCAGDAYCK